MTHIRQARKEDCGRIAEIIIFNYRLKFYPIFKNDEYYFHELQVTNLIKLYEKMLSTLYVYDDGVIKGIIQIEHYEVKKLFVK